MSMRNILKAIGDGEEEKIRESISCFNEKVTNVTLFQWQLSARRLYVQNGGTKHAQSSSHKVQSLEFNHHTFLYLIPAHSLDSRYCFQLHTLL